MEKFNFATAWIFASDGGVGLPLLIGAADSLNHAIPTYGKITRAPKALYNCGLVDINGSHVQLTPHSRTVAADGFARRGSRFSIPDNMRKSLDAASHPAVDSEPEFNRCHPSFACTRGTLVSSFLHDRRFESSRGYSRRDVALNLAGLGVIAELTRQCTGRNRRGPTEPRIGEQPTEDTVNMNDDDLPPEARPQLRLF